MSDNRLCINRLPGTIFENTVKFSETFSLFVLKDYSNKYITYNHLRSDLLISEGAVCSICANFDYSTKEGMDVKKLYILCLKKGDCSNEEHANTIRSLYLHEFKKITDTIFCEYVSPDYMQEHCPHILWQLLLNYAYNEFYCSIKSSKEEEYPSISSANLTSRLMLLFKFIRDKKTDNNAISSIKQIIATEYKVLSNMDVQMSVRTFTTLRKLKYMNKPKDGSLSDLLQKPRYAFDDTSFQLVRVSNSHPKDQSFIIRQLEGKKSSIDFTNLFDETSTVSTKIDGLLRIQKCFNTYADAWGVKPLEFISVDCTIIHTKKYADIQKHSYIAYLKRKKINIITLFRENEKEQTVWSEVFCKKISLFFKDIIKINISDTYLDSSDCLFFVLLHDKEWYESHKVKDAYEIYSGRNIQHVTYEGCTDLNDAVIAALVEELCIKSALKDKDFSCFYPEENTNLIQLINKNIYFIPDTHSGYLNFTIRSKTESQGVYRYFTLRLKKSSSSFDIFEHEDFSDKHVQYFDNFCSKLYGNANYDNVEPVGCIDDGDNSAIIIRTNLVPLPDIGGLKDFMECQKTNNTGIGFRSKEAMKYYCGLTDINHIKINIQNGVQHAVCVGKNSSAFRGSGKKYSVLQKASHLYLFHCPDAIPHWLDDASFYQFFNTYIVRKGQATVLPFPFKLLREHIELFSSKSI